MEYAVMHSNCGKTGIYLGMFLVGIGIVANKCVLEVVFSPDGAIQSPPALVR